MAIKPRTATVPIYQGDDMERIAELRMAAESAQHRAKQAAESGSRRMDDDAGSVEKAAYDAFVIEAAERAVMVRLRAIGRGRFRDLLLEHPARQVDGPDGKETHPEDVAYEANVTTLPDALLTFVDADADVRTIEAPEFSTRKACQDFLDNECAAGDFDKLWMTAYWLNAAPSADPKDGLYSIGDQSSIETSTSPGRLG